MLMGQASIAYGLGQALLAVGLSSAALMVTRALPLPAWGQVAFGAASTPFVTASLLLVLTLVAPGLSTGTLALAPAVLGVILIACCMPRQRPVLARLSIEWRDPCLWAVLASVAIVLFVVLPRLFFYAQQPTANSDGMQYLAQARHFLSHRNFFAIAGMAGLPDGSLRGDAHGALWIAYNASGLAMSSLLGASPFDEQAARLGFQATFLAYLAGGIALASATRLRWMPVLTLIMILTVPNIPGISIGGDRDGFRLTALLLLCAFLMAHAKEGLRSVSVAATLLAGALGYWALQGHALSLVLVPLVVVPWFVLSSICCRSPFRALLVAAAVACGFVLAALPVVMAYQQTGSLTGDNVDAAKVIAGTIYAEGHAAREATRIGEGSVLTSRLRISIARDGGWPSLAAFAIVAVAAFASIRWRISSPTGASGINIAGALLAVWFVSQSLLLLGAFDVGLYKLSDWTVLNARYAMQWYMFAALVVAWGGAVAEPVAEGIFPHHRRAVAAVFGCIVVGMGFLTVDRLQRIWLYYPNSAYVLFSTELNALTDRQPRDCQTLSEDTGVNFYARQPVVQLYSKYVRDLVRETDEGTLLSKLDERKLCTVVLYNGLYVDTAGPNTPLARLLSSPAFHMHDAAPWRIYVRSDLPNKQASGGAGSQPSR